MVRALLFSDLDSFSFSSLIAVARTFINMLSNSGEGGQSYLLHDLRGIAFCFCTSTILS